MKQILFFLFCFNFIVFLPAQETRTFVHPGTLHTKESLEYAYKKATIEKVYPWNNTYTYFSTQSYAKKNVTFSGGDSIATRDASYNTPNRNHKQALENDAYKIYAQGVMYRMTGNDVYATNAIAGLNDWAWKLKKVVGADIELTVGFNAYFMAIGADLVYDYAAWDESDKEQVRKMFREVWYPHVKNIFVQYGNGTWDSACGKCVMAMAVFLEDWTMFDSSYNYFFNGQGNGTIQHYVRESGQCQESSRSQGYVQLGLSNFVEWCEMGYNQGYTDMWDARNGILKNAIEYHAKYNLGEEVPFEEFQYASPVWNNPPNKEISSDGRGQFKPIYYIAYNHYHNRREREMPYCRTVIDEKQTVEQAHGTITDGAGWGSLFFNNPEQEINSSVSTLKEAQYTCWTKGGKLNIIGLEPGDWVEIYSVSGIKITSFHATENTKELTLHNGIFIVKINDRMNKIIIS